MGWKSFIRYLLYKISSQITVERTVFRKTPRETRRRIEGLDMHLIKIFYEAESIAP